MNLKRWYPGGNVWSTLLGDHLVPQQLNLYGARAVCEILARYSRSPIPSRAHSDLNPSGPSNWQAGMAPLDAARLIGGRDRQLLIWSLSSSTCSNDASSSTLYTRMNASPPVTWKLLLGYRGPSSGLLSSSSCDDDRDVSCMESWTMAVHGESTDGGQKLND